MSNDGLICVYQFQTYVVVVAVVLADIDTLKIILVQFSNFFTTSMSYIQSDAQTFFTRSNGLGTHKIRVSIKGHRNYNRH